MSEPSFALTLEQWQILFHETMAAMLRAQEAVKQQFGLWGILNGLWRCSRDLKRLNASLKAISELPDGVLSEEFIQSQIPQLQKLLRSIEDLIDTAKRRHLTNRSLTNAALGSIRIHGEYIADYLDALEMSVDPDVVKAINEGRDQIQRGEFETMEQLS
jgi:ribosomal protein L17